MEVHMKKVLIHSLPLISLAVVSACGKAKPMPVFDSGALPENIVLPDNGSNIMGRYKGEFVTLNTNVNGFLTTSSFIIRKNNKFYVTLKLIGGIPHAWHKQDVYNGSRCPMENDDTNKDGFIDIQEGNVVWGKPIIPLDTDLNTQEAGKNVYPVGDAKGTYTYRRSADFEGLYKDLKDNSTESSFAKLQENEGLPLEGNVIVILGTHENANLPETVATIDGLDRHKSFPIACALITKVNTEDVGTIENDEGNLENPDAPRPTYTPPTTSSDETPEIPEPAPRAEEPDPAPRRTGSDDNDDWDDRLRGWWRRTLGGDDD